MKIFLSLAVLSKIGFPVGQYFAVKDPYFNYRRDVQYGLSYTG